jgi:heterodisulfide reductase subunit D
MSMPGGKILLFSRLVRKQRGIIARILGPRPVSKEELLQIADSLYECSLCGRCMEVCTSSIRTHGLWQTFRSIIYDIGLHPEALKKLDNAITRKGNPYGSDPEMRLLWAEYTGLSEVPIKEKASIIYFIGCTTALKFQTQSIAYAVSTILNKVGENWALLGEKEQCCGSPYLMIGNIEGARKIAAYNVKAIEATEAKIVVTNCPSCYRFIKFDYPRLLGRMPRFEVLHITELLRRYLREGTLSFKGICKERVIYHDPCELVRLGGIMKEPREILKLVARDTVEFPENRTNTRCCGGGGLLQAVNNELRCRMAEKRLKQAEILKAHILLSACPSCKITLSEAVRNIRSDIRILDLAEFTLDFLEM